ncbi:MAG: hypothetical protein K0R67_3662 [Paenibacillus sp.]|nr:hypothetical protein [Paenibacillus sp.]
MGRHQRAGDSESPAAERRIPNITQERILMTREVALVLEINGWFPLYNHRVSELFVSRLSPGFNRLLGWYRELTSRPLLG